MLLAVASDWPRYEQELRLALYPPRGFDTTLTATHLGDFNNNRGITLELSSCLATRPIEGMSPENAAALLRRG
jgi:hypothetical protein